MTKSDANTLLLMIPGVDLSGAQITVQAQATPVITKTEANMRVSGYTDGSLLAVELSAEECAGLPMAGSDVQINWVLSDGTTGGTNAALVPVSA